MRNLFLQNCKLITIYMNYRITDLCWSSVWVRDSLARHRRDWTNTPIYGALTISTLTPNLVQEKLSPSLPHLPLESRPSWTYRHCFPWSPPSSSLVWGCGRGSCRGAAHSQSSPPPGPPASQLVTSRLQQQIFRQKTGKYFGCRRVVWCGTTKYK